MRLRINEKKIKYMKITSIQARRYFQNLTICDEDHVKDGEKRLKRIKHNGNRHELARDHQE